MKKIILTALSVCAVGLCAAGAAACDNSGDDSPSASVPAQPITYTFQVKASVGVSLMEQDLKVVVYDKAGQALASLRLDDSGERTRNMLPDEYVVRLENADGETLYETTTTMSADEPVILYFASVPTKGSGSEYDAYQLQEGIYAVTLSGKTEIFYAFQPSKAGTYRIYSMGTADVAMQAYEGSDSFLHSPTLYDDKSAADKNFVSNVQVSPSDLMGSDGVANDDFRKYFSVAYADKATDLSIGSCLLFIEYVSEEYSPDVIVENVKLTKADEALYDENGNVVPYGTQSGTLTPAQYNAEFVYNETDRYYHIGSKNGPVALMMFTKTPERLLDQPFNKIANPDPNDPADNANPATLHLTFTDPETGKLTVKEYNTLINEIYPSAVNEDGVYPLTQEMYEFLYQFVVVAQNDINVQNVPKELRWKAPCYYYETGEIVDNKPDVSDWTGDTPTAGNGGMKTPFVIANGNYVAAFGSASGIVYYTYSVAADGELTISTDNAKANLYIIKEGQASSTSGTALDSETAEVIGAGSVVLTVKTGDTLSIQVATTDWNPAAIEFTVSYNESTSGGETDGSSERPYTITLGETTVSGINLVWYAFTPAESGTYTFSTLDDNTVLFLYHSTTDAVSFKDSKNPNYRGEGVGFHANLQAGTTYYLQVSEFSLEAFTLTVNIVKAA